MVSGRHAVVVLPLALAGMVSSGAPAAQDPSHRFEIVEEAGVPTALNRGGPRFEGELFSYEHVLTLQQDPAIEASLITRAAAFTMAEDGSYIVLDYRPSRGGPSVARLMVFGPDGRFRRAMGMVGSGPREFFSPQLQNVTGSTIEICDIQLRRTTRYGTDGELLGVTTAPATFTEPFNQLYTSSNGNYVAVRVQNANTEYVYTEFWVVGSDGSVLATHRSPDVKSSIMMDMGGSRPSPYQYPYPPMPAAVYVSEEAFAVSGGVDPVIDIFGLDGDVKRRIRVEDLPLGITAADRERFESFWAERIETYPQAARPLAVQNRSELRKAMPDGKPPWTFISVDDRGYWWLRVQDKPDVWLSGLQSYTYCPESEIR